MKKSRNIVLWGLFLLAQLVTHAVHAQVTQIISLDEFPGQNDVARVLVTDTSFTVQVSTNANIEVDIRVIEGRDLIVADYDAGIGRENIVISDIGVEADTNRVTWTPELRKDVSGNTVGGGTVKLRLFAEAAIVQGTEYASAELEIDLEINRLESDVFWQPLDETVFGTLVYDLPTDAAIARGSSGENTNQRIVYSVAEGPGIVVGDKVYAYEQGTVTLTATAQVNKQYQESFANQNIVFNNVELGTGAGILDQWTIRNPDTTGRPTYNAFIDANNVQVAVGDVVPAPGVGAGESRIATSTDGENWNVVPAGNISDGGGDADDNIHGISVRGTQATGDITVVGNPALPATNLNNQDFEEIVINGITFTFREVSRTATEFAVGGNQTETAANMVTKLNASTIPEISMATYSSVGSVVTITVDENGDFGDNFTYSGDATFGFAPAGNLSGGTLTYVTVGERGQVLISTDATNWASPGTPAGISADHDMHDIAYDPVSRRFVAVGSHRTDNSAEIWISPQDYTGVGAWTEVAITDDFLKGLNAIAIDSNGVAVAVGQFGTVYRTTDVTNAAAWAVQLFFGTTNSFNDVVYGNDEFVLVGDGGEIHTSASGQGWTPRFSNQNKDLNAIEYINFQGNDRVYVAAGDEGVVLTSFDGQQWIERNTRLPYTANGLGVSDNVFYALGNSYSVLSSPSGEAWTIRDTENPGPLGDVSYVDGLYIGVGSEDSAGTQARILKSSDGNSWSNSGITIPVGADGLNGIVSGMVDNGGGSLVDGYVAVGNDGTILTSIDDGDTWSLQTDFILLGDPDNPPVPDIAIPAFTTHLKSVHYADGQFVAVGEQRSILISTDGLQWKVGAIGAAETIQDVTYGDGRWVAVGGLTEDGATGTAYISDDGVRWDERFTVNDTSSLNGVTFFAGAFIAVGDNGKIVTSQAGNPPWTHQSSGSEYDLNSVTATEDTVVAVGETLSVVSSEDGVDWGARISGSLNELNSVVVGDDIFVTVGDFDLIYTSPDGVDSGLDNWNLATVTSPNSPNVNDVIFANDTYVAVGDNGLIRSSTDGVNWEERSIEGITDDFSTVAFGDGLFLAASSNENGQNAIVTSPDGETWTLTYTWANRINDIAYGKGIFAAAGDGGLLFNISIVDRQSGQIIISVDESNVFERGGFVGNEDYKGVSYFEDLEMFVLVGSSSVYEGNYLVGDEIIEDPSMSFLATSFDGINWYRQFVPTIDNVFITDTLNSVSYGAGPYSPLYSTDVNRPELSTDGRFVITSEEGRVLSAYRLFTKFEDIVGNTEGAQQFTIYFLLNRIIEGLEWTDSLYASGNGNSGYVIIGEGGAIYTSKDSINWTLVFNGASDKLNGIAYGNLNGQETFIAVGDSGRVLNSINRRDWNDIRTIDATNTLNGFATGTDGTEVLVAVGNAGGILRSTDGVNWAKIDTQITLDFNGVAFGNGNFVGVNDAGLTAYSPDGLTWTELSSGTTQNLNDIDFAEVRDVFIAVGDAGVYSISTDGSNWSKIINPLDEDLLGVSIRDQEQSVGSIEFTAVPTDDGSQSITVDVDGAGATAAVTLTYVSTVPTSTEVQVLAGDTVEDIASKTVAKLLANVSEASFVADGDTVDITFNTPGVDGNDMTVVGGGGLPVTITALAGGVDELFMVVGEDGFLATSPDSDTWTTQTTPVSTHLFDIVYGNRVFVAVGQEGVVLTSTDGTTWTQQDANTVVDLQAVDYENGFFVVVGGDATIYTSSDGVSWVPRPSNSFVGLNDVGFSNNAYFAVGEFGTIISSGAFGFRLDQTITFAELEDVSFTGTDISFTLGATAPGGDVVYQVAGPATVNGDLITVTGLGEVTVTANQGGNDLYNPAAAVVRTFVSVDATTKTNQSLAIDGVVVTGSFADLNTTFSPNLTITVNAAALEFGTTTATGLPVTLEIQSGAAEIADNVISVTGAGDIVVAASIAGDATYNTLDVDFTIEIAKATQTITFNPPTQVTLGDPVLTLSATSSSLQTVSIEVLSGGGTLDGNDLTISGLTDIQLRAFVDESDNYLAASESRTIDVQAPTAGVFYFQRQSGVTSNLNAVDFLNGGFVAVGNEGRILTSADAENWTEVATGSSVLNGVAFGYGGPGTGRYVAVGNNGDLLTSTNGSDWTIGDSGVTTNLNDVAYLNSRFLAVGDGGVLLRSLDGLTWESIATGVTVNLQEIEFGNDLYVAVGSENTILRTSDLSVFDSVTVLNSDLNTVHFENGSFYVGGTSNSLLVSTDAIQWTVRSSPSNVINSLVHGDISGASGKFVLAGDAGILASSDNGVDWVLRNSGVSSNLNSVAFASEAFVAVGDSGAIVSSGALSARTAQTITINTLVGDQATLGTYSLDASSDSSLDVTYTLVQGDAVIDNDADTITVNTDGVIIYRVSQAGNSQFLPALDASETFTAGDAPKITFPAIGDRALEAGPFTLGATINSSILTISYEIVSGNATVSASTITPTGVGEVTVRAFVDGRSDITPETQTFSFISGGQAHSISTTTSITKTFGDGAFTLAATSDTGATITFSLASGSDVISLTDSTVTISKAGTATVQATAEASGGLLAASEDIVITVEKAPQTIIFNTLPSTILNSETVTLVATSVDRFSNPTGLSVGFDLNSTSNATTINSVLGGGFELDPNGDDATIVVIASRPESDNYLAAENVEQTVIASIVKTQTNITQGLTFKGAAVGTDDTLVAVASNGTIVVDEGGNGTYEFGFIESGTFFPSLNDVAFGNGFFVAVGNSGTVIVSEDGVRWTVVLSQFAIRNYLKIIYAEDRFVAIGTSGRAYYSGVSPSFGSLTLTEATVNNSAILNDIGWGNGTFVTVGQGGVVFSSSNGISWTNHNVGVFDNLNGVAYGSSVFLVVGNGGRRLRSANGTDWSVLNPLDLPNPDDETKNLLSAAFNGSLFNIVGVDGLFLQTTGLGAGASGSDPGDLSPTFTKIEMAPNTDFEAIDYQESRLVATGSNSLLLATGAPNVTTALFSSAEVVADGEWLEDWFGFFVIPSEPIYFHEDLDWLIADSSATDNGAFFYSPEISWFWTSQTAFPWIWVDNAGAWYYVSSDGGTTYYYNASTGWVLAPVSL